MSKFFRQAIALSLMVTLLAALHVLLHNYTFSFVILPLALAVLFAYILPGSALALATLIIISELFTAFPPGVMTAVILAPYALRKLFSKIDVGISGAFYLLVGGAVALQLIILTLANSVSIALGANLTWKEIWHTIPVVPLTASFVLTSLITYSLIVMWHELLLSSSYLPAGRRLKRL